MYNQSKTFECEIVITHCSRPVPSFIRNIFTSKLFYVLNIFYECLLLMECLLYYNMKIRISLQHFDRIIIEGVIVLFYLKCPSKSLYMQFFHFKCEFLKMVHACKLFWQFDRAILKNVI